MYIHVVLLPLDRHLLIGKGVMHKINLSYFKALTGWGEALQNRFLTRCQFIPWSGKFSLTMIKLKKRGFFPKLRSFPFLIACTAVSFLSITRLTPWAVRFWAKIDTAGCEGLINTMAEKNTQICKFQFKGSDFLTSSSPNSPYSFLYWQTNVKFRLGSVPIFAIYEYYTGDQPEVAKYWALFASTR